MTVVHTRPRWLIASTVREGDQLATYAATGDPAGLVAAERDDHDHIEWLDIRRYDSGYDDTPRGVILFDGTVKRCNPDEYVVVRELVSHACDPEPARPSTVGDFHVGDLVTLPDWGPSTVCRVVGFSHRRFAPAPGGSSLDQPMRDGVDVVMVGDAGFSGSYLPERLAKVSP